jgi:ABC-type sugar transport system ATPase subunit
VKQALVENSLGHRVIAASSGGLPVVRADAICKRFDATIALNAVDFDVRPGEIHAVVGENGAGKSTLIRILGGVHPPDSGRIFVSGKACAFASPHEAIAAGIVTIPQELRLVPALSVAENVVLGDLPVRRLGPIALVNRTRMREQASAVLEQLDFHADVRRPVASLGFAERQLVAIAKGLCRESRVFILDEPTAPLEKREVERLFSVLQRMKEQGTAIIFISHQLHEVVAMADRCTVLRDGRVAAISRRGAFSVTDLVGAMTGRSVENIEPVAAVRGETVMAMQPDSITRLELRAGEVIGLAGLLGSGADRMLRRIFGIEEPIEVETQGGRRSFKNPRDAIAAGIGMVPGERTRGLVMNQSVRDNILLPNLDVLSRIGWLDRKAGDRMVMGIMELIDIRPRAPKLKVHALSGGNQQKVILAKWLAREIAVLLLEEPTQGIDVAAKAQIHALIRNFARRGGAALVNSSDLGELARWCDAILPVRRDLIVGRLDRAQGLDERELRAAIGG